MNNDIKYKIRSEFNNLSIIKNFVDFACTYLNVKKPKITLSYDKNDVETTAAYGNKEVIVYIKNRALVDILRSIAHEIVHHHQYVNGRLKAKDHYKNNSDGSKIENEANAIAGEIIRKYGKIKPMIYEK